MSFAESVRNFAYSEAAKELGVDVSSPQAWSDLEKAALAEKDLDRVQAIHDLSWVLTQCKSEETAKLTAMRDAVKRTVEDAYGPRIWELAEEEDVTLEGLVVPTLKVDLTPVKGAETALDYFERKRNRTPNPMFAAVFVKCWLHRFVVGRLEEHHATRGRRQFVGTVNDCGRCEQGLRDGVFKRRLEEVREDQLARTNRNLRKAHDGSGGFHLGVMAELLGEEILCPVCSRWISVPEDARDGWVWPMTSGRDEVCAWTTLRLGE